jgi:hypothetical protein
MSHSMKAAARCDEQHNLAEQTRLHVKKILATLSQESLGDYQGFRQPCMRNEYRI